MNFKLPTTIVGFFLFNLFALTTLVFGFNAYDVLHTDAIILPLPSGEIWRMAYGDLFICMVMLAIFLEVIRQTSGEISKPQTHMVSLAIFIFSLLEFLLFRAFGNSYFFLFLLASFIDFVVTWMSTIIRAKRDFRITGGGNQ